MRSVQHWHPPLSLYLGILLGIQYKKVVAFIRGDIPSLMSTAPCRRRTWLRELGFPKRAHSHVKPVERERFDTQIPGVDVIS